MVLYQQGFTPRGAFLILEKMIMSDKTTVEGTTGWTIETLKESVDQRFAENQKAVDTAMLSSEKAVNAALLAAKEAVIKAEISTEKRFDSVNEAMSKVASQSADLLPRAEYFASHKAIDDKVDVITSNLNKTSGDKNLYATHDDVAELLQKTHADFSEMINKLQDTIKPVIEYVNRQQGSAAGSQITMGKIYATLGAFSAVLGIIIYLVSQISR